MIRKATKAAYALSATLDNCASATIINKLYSQLIEPILLYGAEQWLPYTHPRKINQVGPTETFANLNTQLPTEMVWKGMIYSHYSLHKTTPTLGVRAELGAFPTYILAIQRLTNYMAYLADPELHPLAAKAKIVQQSLAADKKPNSPGGTTHGEFSTTSKCPNKPSPEPHQNT